MTPFEEMLQRDIKNVFLNPNEFGEAHTLNGVTYNSMVVDNDQLEQWKALNLASGISQSDHALADAQVYIFVALEDFPEPNINEVIRFDNRPLRVISTSANNGMLELVLGGTTEYGR